MSPPGGRPVASKRRGANTKIATGKMPSQKLEAIPELV
jgi:hypothetical protein